MKLVRIEQERRNHIGVAINHEKSQKRERIEPECEIQSGEGSEKGRARKGKQDRRRYSSGDKVY